MSVFDPIKRLVTLLHGGTEVGSGNRLPVDSVLAGRTIEQVKAFDALALTTTTLQLSGDLSIFRTYPNKALTAYSSLDQTVEINLYSNIAGGDLITAGQGVNVGGGGIESITFERGGNEWGHLISPSPSGMQIQVSAKAATAPTTGALTVIVVGWF